MTPEEYSSLAMVTDGDADRYAEIAERIKNYAKIVVGDDEHLVDRVRLLHAMMGLSSESGEVADALKKHIFYGQPLDVENLLEEAGDLLWYMNLLLVELRSSFEEIMERNINKLKKRYPEGFTNEHAKIRLDKQDGQ